jgi:hypothetical protein
MAKVYNRKIAFENEGRVKWDTVCRVKPSISANYGLSDESRMLLGGAAQVRGAGSGRDGRLQEKNA